ncbi:hypothetical protein AB0G85_37375 [Streptomyces sioyaensis]|uniref:hypothetical protein n=1 Tax=Streptomyces sioyaensis TaxID=67364 RepID=UPI0033CF8FAF
MAASGQDDHTLVWRADGWLELLPQLRTPLDWLIGLPFGTGYKRVMDGILVSLSPHNYFVQLLLRLGLIGVCALTVLYAAVWRSAAAQSDASNDTSKSSSAPGLLFRLLICGQLVFCVADPLFPEQAMILGLLIVSTRPRPALESNAPAIRLSSSNLPSADLESPQHPLPPAAQRRRVGR